MTGPRHLTSQPWRRAALGLIGTVAVFALAACSEDAGGSDAAVPVVRVATGESGAEFRFELPDRLAAGPTRLSLSNGGREAHHAQIFRLDDGATIDDLTAALATGELAAALEVGTFVGGTGLVSAGEESRADAIVDLGPGQYALICLVPGADGAPHVAHGMIRPFEVAATDDATRLPEPDEQVRLVDYAFDLPDTITGDATLAITNAAEAEAHELIIARLDDGVGAEDVLAALHDGTPLPATALGGMQAIPPGTTQHLQLDLEPGRYVVLCAVPLADGTSHYDAGMIEEVTIT